VPSGQDIPHVAFLRPGLGRVAMPDVPPRRPDRGDMLKKHQLQVWENTI